MISISTYRKLCWPKEDILGAFERWRHRETLPEDAADKVPHSRSTFMRTRSCYLFSEFDGFSRFAGSLDVFFLQEARWNPSSRPLLWWTTRFREGNVIKWCHKYTRGMHWWRYLRAFIVGFGFARRRMRIPIGKHCFSEALNSQFSRFTLWSLFLNDNNTQYFYPGQIAEKLV